MKKLFTLLAAVLFTATTYAQIGINNENPDASAALDITSTTGGFLPPRMTNAQRQAISNPAAGLQVFVTDFEGGRFMFYDGTEWGTLSFTEKRPDAPTIGTATAVSSGEATVPFTAPSSDGGSAITSYTATSSPGDFTGTISQSGSGSIIVSGLTSGTTYTFTVTATNAIGTSLASAVSNSVVTPQPQVGDFYGGGVVFKLFHAGQIGYVEGETHGLIAAVQDDSSIRWYNGSYDTTGATGTAIGTGATNTTTIISEQGPTETSYAAGLARANTGGGYTDWFLPSKAELNKMWLERETINTIASANGGSNFSNNWYWSSTESGSSHAWIHHLSDGGTQVLDKSYSVWVRAVRAF
ncbi:DUF1566 domain-containing protein [Flavobacteriaceae bacterium]|nr:DUF1566 domain-containing protein [Flavobacteriaceae bacterium]